MIAFCLKNALIFLKLIRLNLYIFAKEYLFMSSEELLRVFHLVYSEDARFKILRVLASREAVNLRALSRAVGMDHKSVRRYLEKLVSIGLVREVQVSPTSRVYELNGEFNFLRELFQQIR